MTADTQPTLSGLAATIAEATKAITSYLNVNGLPQPSFSEDGPADYPKAPEIEGQRFQLIEALQDMLRLAMGPSESIFFQPLLVRVFSPPSRRPGKGALTTRVRPTTTTRCSTC